jgi:hypothetical protein
MGSKSDTGDSVNTCEFVVGRLMEIRVAAGYRSVQDIDQMIRMMMEASATLPSPGKYVIAADWRAVSVMDQATALRAKEMLASSNPRVVRSSILIQPNQATANLQVLRLVKEAANKNRRHFTSPSEQATWLREVLTEQEQRQRDGADQHG